MALRERGSIMTYKTLALMAGLIALGLFGTADGGGDGVKPINLESVNTDADEVDPCAATDNLTLYYASNASGTFGIYASKRIPGKDAWPAGKVYEDLLGKDAD